jgi:hypothetical protein
MPHLPSRITVVGATAVTAIIALGVGTAFAASGSSTTTGAAAATTRNGSHAKDPKIPQDATLQQIQAAAATAISKRVSSLNTAIAKVDKTADLGSDQATLLGTLRSDETGLTQLGQTIAGDNTLPTAKTDYKEIFSDYRVYALVLPVTRQVVVDDRIINTAGARLTKVAARIAAHETPADQTEVQALLTDLANQVSAATAAVKGQPATLEGYTPADWNANHQLLNTARSATKTAVADLVKARSDAKQAAADEGLKVR